MLTQDGLDFTFSHRSFQEYFAAVYTVSLPDDIQRQLFKVQITGHGIGLLGTNYVSILYELEQKRLERNFLLPLLKEWKCEFVDNGSSYRWLLRTLLYGLSCSEMKEGQHKGISYAIRNGKRFELLLLITRLHGFNNGQAPQAKECEAKLAEYIINFVKPSRTLKFEEIKEAAIWDLVDGVAVWLYRSFDDALVYLGEMEREERNLELDVNKWLSLL